MIRTAVLAHRARRHGAHHAWKIVVEARRARIHVNDAFALVEQESNFRNIFGHDPGGPFPGLKVTRDRVDALLRHVDNGGTSNGVGLTQLTWPPFIRQADKMLGGAANPRNQLIVSFNTLARLQRQYGRHNGFVHYNGGGSAAEQYADVMMLRAQKWSHILWPKELS